MSTGPRGLVEPAPRKETPLLQMTAIKKTFGNTRALRGVDFDVRAGEVHALLGQNGSGKSTLMKIAYGELPPTSGRLVLGGREQAFASPRAALLAGIAAVPQEVPVVRSLSVVENILLGRLPVRAGRIDWRGARRRAATVLRTLGANIALDSPVDRLGPSERQVVAIARALAQDARILVLDEPTSSLSADQDEALFDIVRDLKRRGHGIIFISQRLQDVQGVADRVTVLRDGLVAGTLTAASADHDAITQLMIGRSLSGYFHKRGIQLGPPVLEVEGLTKPGRFEDVSFAVRAGEVLGIAGLVGCGRVELLRSIFRADSPARGRVAVEGREYRAGGPAASVRLGLGMVTGDRESEGLVPPLSVHENVALVRHRRVSLSPLRDRGARSITQRLVDTLSIQTPHLNVPVSTLSGGNQQKVVLARWLDTNMKVLLLDDPTRGIDVGAKAEIYRIISDLAAAGVGIIVSSSENPELLGMCDRLLVMFRGRVVAEMDAGTASERDVVAFAAGAHL